MLAVNLNTKIVSETEINESITPQILKYSKEYYVLAVLRYLFPGKYDDLIKLEEPDLQKEDHSLGVEVVMAVSEKEMAETRKAADKNTNSSLFFTAFGGGRIDADLITALKKKNEKVLKYRHKVRSLYLAIILDMPLTECVRITLQDFLKSNQMVLAYDSVIILCWDSCVVYTCSNHSFQDWKLEDRIRRRLGTIARMTAEGRLDLSAPEWQ